MSREKESTLDGSRIWQISISSGAIYDCWGRLTLGQSPGNGGELKVSLNHNSMGRWESVTRFGKEPFQRKLITRKPHGGCMDNQIGRIKTENMSTETKLQYSS